MFLLLCLGIVSTSLRNVAAVANNSDVFLRPSNGATSGNTVIFIMPGADIPSESYIPLAKEIQSAYNGALYVAIPAFVFEDAFTFDFSGKISEMLKKMQNDYGLTKDNPILFVAGHSLGGESLQGWTYANQFNYKTSIGIDCTYKGQILLNAYINRRYRDKNTTLLKNYTIPTISLGGEWDGLVHETRMFEQYYVQLILPTISPNSSSQEQNRTRNNIDWPVIVVRGASHMQASSITGEYGTDVPSFVLKHDLKANIPYNQTHQEYAKYITAFIRLQLGTTTATKKETIQNKNKNKNNKNTNSVSSFSHSRSEIKMHGSNEIDSQHFSFSYDNINIGSGLSDDYNTILSGLNSTFYIARPYINALIEEGFYYFKQPCDCQDLICESTWYCNAGSPWSSNISQLVISGIDDLPSNTNVSLINIDSFHPTYQVNPIHYAKIYNNCSDIYNNNTSQKKACILHSSTVTQNKYNFQDSIVDDGGTSQSAYEMRTKMKSLQSFHKALNITIGQENFNVCYKINQKSIDYAVNNTPSYILDRYYAIGEEIAVGPDIYTRGGPGWTFPPLSQNTSACNQDTHRYYNEVRSQYLYTNLTCFFAQDECGVHYCKVLSPARAMEWIYIESLRFNQSLINIANGINGTYCK